MEVLKMIKHFITSTFFVSSLALASDGFVRASNGQVVKNGAGTCWTSASSTIGAVPVECGGKVEAKSAPVAAVETVVVKQTFGSSKAQLKAQKQGEIEQIANKAKANLADKPIVVRGYADRRGGEAFNNNLSLQRAENVKSLLVKSGIPANRVVIEARGNSESVNSKDCIQGSLRQQLQCLEKDRRVEVELPLKKKTL
jgi:outer membrane protein OmpA-like peptidoglycan-associated protein